MMTHTCLKITSASVSQTHAIGEIIASCLKPGDWIALDGELGAGKTQLVRGLAQGLGLNPAQVASPTFVLMHEYESEDEAGPLLVHIDAYRLTGAAELEDLGCLDQAPFAITVVEWADRVRAGMGDDCLAIEIQHVDEHQRTLWLTGVGRWMTQLTHLADQLNPYQLKAQ